VVVGSVWDDPAEPTATYFSRGQGTSNRSSHGATAITRLELAVELLVFACNDTVRLLDQMQAASSLRRLPGGVTDIAGRRKPTLRESGSSVGLEYQ
jgi:hypothetical protein